MATKLKPKEVPGADEKFMSMALLASSFSKDRFYPSGAIVVLDSDDHPSSKKIIATGWNGVPMDLRDDSEVDWSAGVKEHFLMHAEEHALTIAAQNHNLLNAIGKATLYSTVRPCRRCIRMAANLKIHRVVYFPNIVAASKEEAALDEEVLKFIVKNTSMFAEEFSANMNWMRDWMTNLEKIGVFQNT